MSYRIDWANPLCKGLLAAYVFGEAGTDVREVISGRKTAPNGSNNFVVTNSNSTGDRAINVTTPATTNRWDVGYPATLGAEGTVLFRVAPNYEIGTPSSDTSFGFLGLGANDDTGAIFYWNDGDTFATMMTRTPGSRIIETTISVQPGEMVTGCTSCQAGTQHMAINGKITARQTYTETWGTGDFDIGGGAQGVNMNSQISLALVWGRALTEAESCAMTADPWQVFIDNARPIIGAHLLPEHVDYGKVKVPWKHQPPAGTEIDWSNPITRDMFFLLDCSGGVPHERVKDIILETVNTTATIAPTDRGLAVHNTLNGSGSFRVPEIDSLKAYYGHGHPGLTMFAIVRNNKGTIDASGAESVLVFSGAGDDGYAFYWGQGEDVEFNADTTDNGSSDSVGDNLDEYYDAGTAGTPDPREWNVLGGQWNGATIHTRVNEYKTAGVALTGTTAPDFGQTDNTLVIGNGALSGEAAWDGQILFVALWRRDIGDPAWNDMLENPWQVFKPREIMVPINQDLPDLVTWEEELDEMPWRPPR